MIEPKEIQAPAVSLKYIAWSVKEISENVKKISSLAEAFFASHMNQPTEHGSQTHFKGSGDDPMPFQGENMKENQMGAYGASRMEIIPKEIEKALTVGKRGRPPKQIDVELVRKLSAIHCTVEEIASVVGCCRDTLSVRPDLKAAIDAGNDFGKMSMKRKMHEVAMTGNVQMLIWLSKQRLGYKDRQPEEVPNTIIHVSCNELPI